MYEIVVNGCSRTGTPYSTLKSAVWAAKRYLRSPLPRRVEIWPVPRYHTMPSKIYFNDSHLLMTTKATYAVISYVNADAPADVQVHQTPYDPPEGRIVWIATQSNDLMRVPMPVLVAAYNLLTNKSTTRFATRPKGVIQVWRAMQEWLGKGEPEELTPDVEATAPAGNDPSPAQDDTTMATKTTARKRSAKKTPITAKKSAEKKGRPTRFTTDSVITVVAKENPKRANSAAGKRFALYKSGMTVQQFLDKGGWRADINWDVKQGFIKVSKG